MHIPDGYLSPTTAVVLYGAAAPFWWRASRVVKRLLTGQTVPLLALFSAFCFTVMMFNIPVPGGTTAHAVGGTLAAIVLGPWPAIIAVSVALIIQAIFFGDGGITAIGANCFNMAIVLPLVGYGVYRLLARNAAVPSRRRVIAAAIGSYVGINVAGLLVGIELGIQPIFWSQNGHALYAPYSLSVAIPAMLIPHLTLAGAAEAIATAFGVAYVQRVQPQLLLRGPSGAAGGEARAPAPAHGRLIITAAIAVVMLVAVPLGLLAGGSAWGEWDPSELGGNVGYVPSGLQRLHGVWSAPLSGYSLPWIPAGAPFAEQAVGYILSAVVGAGLILIAAFAVRILARRRAASASGG
ncbi:MAG TPA: cobalt transporter CbiM [Thermomicrobiaceae bacterium]|nr:cobalt transporter CbiM [Thermomicrobiaceae bacterium]